MAYSFLKSLYKLEQIYLLSRDREKYRNLGEGPPALIQGKAISSIDKLAFSEQHLVVLSNASQYRVLKEHQWH